MRYGKFRSLTVSAMSADILTLIRNMPPIEGGDEYLIRGEYYSAKDKTKEGT